MWEEENTQLDKVDGKDLDLRSVGVSAGGIDADMENIDAEPTGDTEGVEMGGVDAATPPAAAPPPTAG